MFQVCTVSFNSDEGAAARLRLRDDELACLKLAFKWATCCGVKAAASCASDSACRERGEYAR